MADKGSSGQQTLINNSLIPMSSRHQWRIVNDTTVHRGPLAEQLCQSVWASSQPSLSFSYMFAFIADGFTHKLVWFISLQLVRPICCPPILQLQCYVLVYVASISYPCDIQQLVSPKPTMHLKAHTSIRILNKYFIGYILVTPVTREWKIKGRGWEESSLCHKPHPSGKLQKPQTIFKQQYKSDALH